MTLQELAWILVAATVGGALLAWRTAPAVTFALLSGLVGAIAACRVAWIYGPEGVPAEVASWFSVGLLVGAIFGTALTRRRERGTRPMSRWAVAVLLSAPFACVAFTFSLQDACPLYVQAGICDFMGADLMGGWITSVVFLFAIDLLVITVLLWFAPGPSKGRTAEGEAARPQPASSGRLVIAGAWIAVATTILVVAFTRPSELEAWRSAQPDAESFAPNLLDPVPEEPVGGCPPFGNDDRLFRTGFDPERVQWLDGHVPRWLPDDFGLVDWVISEEDLDEDAGDWIESQSVGVWADRSCRRVSLVLFEANPDSPRLDRNYSVVDEVGDWAVMTGPKCKRSAIADDSCLQYFAWSYEERGERGGTVLGLQLHMQGIDRDVGDRIALGIPV
ncbi:MAG: hypothetical protein ACXWZF_11580 [Actinomycetota bacterium]